MLNIFTKTNKVVFNIIVKLHFRIVYLTYVLRLLTLYTEIQQKQMHYLNDTKRYLKVVLTFHSISIVDNKLIIVIFWGHLKIVDQANFKQTFIFYFSVFQIQCNFFATNKDIKVRF